MSLTPSPVSGFLLGLVFNREDGSDTLTPKLRLTFNGLYCVLFWKTTLQVKTVIKETSPGGVK